ncbi:MAG: NCS2 family permease [Verrucomicrobiia bacterium]
MKERILKRICDYFEFGSFNTSFKTEFFAGVTTFLTMAYIIFVQPAVLSGAIVGQKTGMDFGAVTTATCLSAAIASIIMGIYARYPVAQAPGMGQNFFFVLSAVPAAAAAGYSNAWETALGVVFISGVLFLILSFYGVREAVLNSLSPAFKNAIAAGIGLFIAFIGLQNAGLVVRDPGTGVKLTHNFGSPDILIFFIGLLVAAALHSRKIAGSILIGILVATIAAIVLKFSINIMPESVINSRGFKESMFLERFKLATGIVSSPPSLSPTFLKLDIRHALSIPMIPFIVVFLFMVLFDTVGTLVGVAEQAGLMRDNQLPRARQAFASDALGTTIGACLGTSTVTSYIESAAGVEQGGRTGLTAIVAGLLFIVAMFFNPLISMVGSYTPITAPALVIVGAMMMRNVTKIDWADYSESLPAFLVIIGIPLSYSIGDGLALGFLSYPIIKLLAGRQRDVKPIFYVLAVLIGLYFLTIR